MSILPEALLAVKEGPDSPAFSRLRELVTDDARPYPYIVAVDFDGTLCENAWPEIGAPHQTMLEVIRLLRRLGVLVVLWSCREEGDLEDAVEWCAGHGLAFDAVNENCRCVIDYFEWNTRKIHADEYWDDRAVTICYDEKGEIL